ncbi:MAG: hypothetical protein HRF50_17295 [Phycisphaerae bacterium]|jgi:hypothetical protein
MAPNSVNEQPPEICGFECAFAAFPPADTAGICRTMAAVWCGKLQALVNKNTPCEWRRRCAGRGADADAPVVRCASVRENPRQQASAANETAAARRKPRRRRRG